MDHLWAPWRMAYVTKPKPTVVGHGSVESCFICDGLAARDDRANLIVRRESRSVVLLNRYPYNNGHLLIAPARHVATLDGLDADELLELQLVLRHMMGELTAKMKPDGFNVGLNLGRVAGAGLPGHLHWHIVPRWAGDVNFMPVVADVKVIVQSLDALWNLLRAEDVT